LSRFLYLVYINNLLDELESSGYGSKVMSVCTGNPAFTDDILLLALTPSHLQRLVDIVHTFCLHWKVSVNVDKSSITVFTKRRAQPSACIWYGDQVIKQTASFVHLGISYCFNTKIKDRIFCRLQKAKNALFSMAAQGIHAQRINPLLSADLYSKVVVPIALYGSELWSNMTATELNTISRFQHYAVKRIQGLPTSTRFDMESMLGLNRLPAQIESRKLMFLHKILSLASNSVTKNIFIRKLILFINNNTLVSMGFISDICNILFKYNLLSIVNNILVPDPNIPSKNEWKKTVKIAISERESHDWDQRMSLDRDFTFFRILHPCIAPWIVYQVCNRSFFWNIMCVVARLWVRPVSLDNIMCEMCGVIYQEQLVHYLCECETQTSWCSTRPNSGPYYSILHSSYTHIVQCLKVIIE